jgi:uncharacterized protein YdiU (UPF0061 family)
MTTTGLGLLELGNTFRAELAELGVDWQPAPVPRPQIVVANDALALELGVDPVTLHLAEGWEILAGNVVPDGATPVAMAYAGHQFGHYSPRLGDGRALLLGEVTDRAGDRRDLHLKGSGRTPFARGGDGKAALGPMLREYLVSEAMAALGIPTTRGLAVVTTGELIAREDEVPGAVLVRVAASHLRVGTFQYAARLGDPEILRRLAKYAIARHHPGAADADRPALALLDAVIEAQAGLVARWMLVGFIHGVMNTDNMTISGETIDYGPCAFLDAFDPATVFSSIDHGGRYAYGNQPAVALWNLSRLAESLLPIIDPDPEQAVTAATESVRRFGPAYNRYWEQGMATKLGLSSANGGGSATESEASVDPTDAALVEDYLTMLGDARIDYTQSFRHLATLLRDDQQAPGVLARSDRFAPWAERWRTRLATRAKKLTGIANAMDAVNPIYIPRNHLVEEALTAAVAEGDLEPFSRLLSLVVDPYRLRVDGGRYAEPAPDDFTQRYRTFCGT